MFRHITTGLLLLLVTANLNAATAARLQTLQSPVWLERAQERRVLTLGEQLQDGDRVITGKAARAVLLLADGSRVKLGENARFEVTQLKAPEEEGGFLSGALNVLKGAFRYTTGLISKRYKRDLRVSVATATIGIRGTDVWGKAEEERDFVVLLEGSVEIERDGQTVTLEDPLTLFMAPRNQPAQPLQGVSMQQVSQWAEETEPQTGQGVRSEEGQWRLHLASYRSAEELVRVQQLLRAAGIDSAGLQVSVGGQDWQRLFIDKFVSREDALSLAEQLTERFGFSTHWVQKQP